MRELQIAGESVRVSASTQRALEILNRGDGCAMSSRFASGSASYPRYDRVDRSVGVEVKRWNRGALDYAPPWVVAYAEGHPRASVFLAVSPASFARFDALVDALRARVGGPNAKG